MLILFCNSFESRQGVYVMKSDFSLFQKDFGDSEITVSRIFSTKPCPPSQSSFLVFRILGLMV